MAMAMASLYLAPSLLQVTYLLSLLFFLMMFLSFLLSLTYFVVVIRSAYGHMMIISHIEILGHHQRSLCEVLYCHRHHFACAQHHHVVHHLVSKGTTIRRHHDGRFGEHRQFVFTPTFPCCACRRLTLDAFAFVQTTILVLVYGMAYEQLLLKRFNSLQPVLNIWNRFKSIILVYRLINWVY